MGKAATVKKGQPKAYQQALAIARTWRAQGHHHAHIVEKPDRYIVVQEDPKSGISEAERVRREGR